MTLRHAAAALMVFAIAAPAAFIATSAPFVAQAKTLGAKVGKLLQEAQALAKEKKFKEALVKAKEAEALPGKTPYEELVVQDFLTYLHVSLRDYGKGALSAEAAYNTGQWPAEEKGKRLKSIAELNYQSRNYAKTVSFAERYFNEVGQNADLSALVAQSYFQQGNYAKALQTSQDLIRSAERAGKKPSETTLQIAQSSAFRLKDGRSTKETLFKLVQLYPKPAYWADLIRAIKNQTGMSQHLTLDVLRLQLAAGQMKVRTDFVRMSEIALQLGLPGEAQRVLEKGFATSVLGVGTTPDAARERRLLATAKATAATDKATLSAQAANAAATVPGDDDIKIGEAYETYGDNQNALVLLAGGLAKNGLKSPDEARMVLGRVQLNLKLKAEARSTFAAIKTDLKYAELGRAWSILSYQLP